LAAEPAGPSVGPVVARGWADTCPALVVGALDAAVAIRGRHRMPDTIFRSDRGSESTSTVCIDACARLGLRRSYEGLR
jgi:hypothetical protein